MVQIDDVRAKEIKALTGTIRQELTTLANTLEGRLSPAEKDALANLIQLQLSWQSLFEQTMAESAFSPAVSTSPVIEEGVATPPTSNRDSIVYAQAMQYARDLVKAIRQKKEQQRRLELTSQQLIRAEKLATIGQVAAVVAHELGNILTPLLMYAKLIQKESSEKKDLSEIAEFAGQITKIAGRASDMLRQLVDAARTEGAMMIPIDVRHVIDDALALLVPRIERQGINVTQHYPDDLPLILGRPDQLEQLFINISLNAFDAMPNGGDFTVTLELGEGGDHQPHEIDYIVISLSDTGEGISPQDIALLFEPFYSTKERGAGSGLGLFVSYLIIDQHGGTIDVDSKPGAGTTFSIKLPTAATGGS
jgi:two-component system NtrC family sensor kinase